MFLCDVYPHSFRIVDHRNEFFNVLAVLRIIRPQVCFDGAAVLAEMLVPRLVFHATIFLNVNGNVDIQNFRNTVASSVVNGIVNATDITGSVNATVTNGTINGKVYLPENGSCTLSLVNGNISLLVPRTLSASVSASVTVGTVSVTNLPITFTTNTRTSVIGVVGGGKGTVRLSSVTGVVQLIGL